MATIFYGINIGDDTSAAVISATTTGKDVEIAVNSTAHVPTRDLLSVALERLNNVIDQNNYLPL